MLSIQHLLVVLVIVMLVFGTKKVKSIGGDVGGWIRDFKKALREGEQEAAETPPAHQPAQAAPAQRVIIDGEPVAQTDQAKAATPEHKNV